MTILGIFPPEVNNIIFEWRGACELRLKQTSEMKVGVGRD